MKIDFIKAAELALTECFAIVCNDAEFAACQPYYHWEDLIGPKGADSWFLLLVHEAENGEVPA